MKRCLIYSLTRGHWWAALTCTSSDSIDWNGLFILKRWLGFDLNEPLVHRPLDASVGYKSFIFSSVDYIDIFPFYKYICCRPFIRLTRKGGRFSLLFFYFQWKKDENMIRSVSVPCWCTGKHTTLKKKAELNFKSPRGDFGTAKSPRWDSLATIEQVKTGEWWRNEKMENVIASRCDDDDGDATRRVSFWRGRGGAPSAPFTADRWTFFWCFWRFLMRPMTFPGAGKKSAQNERPPRRAIVAPSNGRSHSNWQLLWFPLFRRGATARATGSLVHCRVRFFMKRYFGYSIDLLWNLFKFMQMNAILLEKFVN